MTHRHGPAPRVVAGIGMSSAATAHEVAATLADALARCGLGPDALAVVATRTALADDPRLAGTAPVVGVADDRLVAHAPAPGGRPGLPARVSAAAAELVAGAPLLGPTVRSSHVTVSLAALDPARPA